MPSQDNNSDNGLHAAAADLYGTNIQKNTPNQRELEAHVLLKSAKFLKDIQNDWDNTTPEVFEETLKYNRQIWMMFYDTALENSESDRPSDLRSNIINLANFVFKRELDIMGTPEKKKLDVLLISTVKLPQASWPTPPKNPPRTTMPVRTRTVQPPLQKMTARSLPLLKF